MIKMHFSLPISREGTVSNLFNLLKNLTFFSVFVCKFEF